MLQEGEIGGVIGVGKVLGKVKTGNLGQIFEETELISAPGVETVDDPGIALGSGLQAGGNEPLGF